MTGRTFNEANMEYRGESLQVLRDWQSRELTRLRANLPADYTTPTLHYIRTMACQASGVTDCLFWAARHPTKESLDDSDSPCFPCASRDEAEEEANPPEVNHYPCPKCKNPGISMFEFSAALFGKGEANTEAKLDKEEKDRLLEKSKRIIRRFVNDSAPMQPGDFKRAIANAWANDWLTPVQVVSILQEVIRLEATSTALRRLRKLHNATTSDSIDSAIAVEEEKLWKNFFQKSADVIARDRNISKTDKQQLLADLAS